MKLSIYLFALVSVLTVVAVGCSTEKKPATAGASPLDVGPTQPSAKVTSTPVYTPPTPAYAPPATPTGEQWATTATPTITETKTASKAADASGSTYTVKKGDTLFKIAKDHYGDAKMINKIAAANPGMDANKLKIGQKIVLP